MAAPAWLRGRRVSLGVLVLILIGAFLLSVAVGAYSIAPHQTFAALLAAIGIPVPIDYTMQQASVLTGIRLPRLVLAALVGAALAVSGATVQAIFRNPLASPSLIGISGGAAVGAATAIILGMSTFSRWTVPIFAFLGALGTTLIVYSFARRRGRTEVTTLLLAGIAINAMMTAIINLYQHVSNEIQLQAIVFWLMGSLSGATWDTIGLAFPFIFVAVVLLLSYGRQLNLLILGDAEARHLGVETEKVRLACITLTALATGAAVAVSGVIVFVGLVVPHILRMIVGPDHRILLPASALGGAIMLILADTLARTIVAPAQLAIGLVTGLISAPFFLYLIERTRKEHGGWG